jgi:hypothetical protein
MKRTSKKTCILAALPLVLSLAVISTTHALARQPDWLDARDIPRGSYLLIPYRHTEEGALRGAERWSVLPPAMAQSHDRARDPFADTYFD